MFPISVAVAAEPDATVVVTTPLDRTADPVAATVISVEDLPASADVAAALEPVPGLRVRHLGGLGDFSGVSIRGTGLRETQVFLDGVPLSPDGAAVVNLSELPLRAFRSIEVYRGNAPAALGAAPIGGVVNLVTGDRRPPSVSVGVGTQGTVRASLGLAPASAGWRGFGFVDTFHTDGNYRYFSDHGTAYNRLDDAFVARVNNDKTQLAAHGLLGTDLGEWKLSVVGSGLVRDEGLPGHLQQRTESARLETARGLLGAELSGRGARTAWTALAFTVLRREIVSDPGGEIGVGSVADTRTGSVGLRGDWRITPSPSLVAGVVGQARVDGWKSPSDLRTRLVGTASAWATWRHGRFAVGPTVDLRGADARGLGEVTLDGVPSGEKRPLIGSIDPRLGATLRLDPVTFKANVGKYLRIPDLTELYGQRGSSVGNPDLVPEKGYQADLGAIVSRPDLGPLRDVRLEAGGFVTASRDLVVWVQNSQQVLYPINLGRGLTAGTEVAGSAAWGPVGAHGSATWTWSSNRSSDPAFAGNELPRVPALDASGGATADLGPARIGWDILAVSANWWDATNWLRSAPRVLHTASVRVNLGDGLALEGTATNVLGKLVEVVPRNPLDPDDPARVVQPMTDFVGYPLPGRTLLVTLRWDPP